MENVTSCATAKRMGFKEEGVLRWMWVLPEGMEGNGIQVRKGDPEGSRPGRDKEHVQRLIDRR